MKTDDGRKRSKETFFSTSVSTTYFTTQQPALLSISVMNATRKVTMDAPFECTSTYSPTEKDFIVERNNKSGSFAKIECGKEENIKKTFVKRAIYVDVGTYSTEGIFRNENVRNSLE